MQNDEQNQNQQRNHEWGKIKFKLYEKNSAPEKNKSQNRDKEQVSTEKDFPKEMRKTIETSRENSKKYRKRQRQIVCRDHIILAPSPSLSSSYRGNSDRVHCQVDPYEKESEKVLMGAWSIHSTTQVHTHTFSTLVEWPMLLDICPLPSTAEKRHKYMQK